MSGGTPMTSSESRLTPLLLNELQKQFKENLTRKLEMQKLERRIAVQDHQLVEQRQELQGYRFGFKRQKLISQETPVAARRS